MSANALTVGPNGTTNPTLNVNTNTTNAATGLNITGAAAAAGLAIATTSSGTNENLTIDAKGSGTVTINGTATGIVALPAGSTIGGSVPLTSTITSSSATAFQVGPNGATNPVFDIDASVTSQVSGLKVQGRAAGNSAGVVISVTSSGTNENMTFTPKGTGTVALGSGTGSVTLAGTGGTFINNIVTLAGGTAVTAGGAQAAAIGSSAGIGFYFGSGAPTVTAPQGSLYLRTDGSSTSTRLYVNTTGSTTWTNVTTGA